MTCAYCMWHMTCDMWNVTHDTWHMTCYTWYVTLLSKFQLPSFYDFWVKVLWQSFHKDESLNFWVKEVFVEQSRLHLSVNKIWRAEGSGYMWFFQQVVFGNKPWVTTFLRSTAIFVLVTPTFLLNFFDKFSS